MGIEGKEERVREYKQRQIKRERSLKIHAFSGRPLLMAPYTIKICPVV